MAAQHRPLRTRLACGALREVAFADERGRGGRGASTRSDEMDPGLGARSTAQERLQIENGSHTFQRLSCWSRDHRRRCTQERGRRHAEHPRSLQNATPICPWHGVSARERSREGNLHEPSASERRQVRPRSFLSSATVGLLHSPDTSPASNSFARRIRTATAGDPLGGRLARPDEATTRTAQ